MNSKQPLIVDRILFPAMFYPYNYGFIPQTKEQQPGSNGEADPIDVFILGNYSLWSAIACRPVGIILSKDQDGIDSKIIAVPLTNIDPTFSTVLDIDDVPECMRMQLKHFIEHPKDLEEGKYVTVTGWQGKKDAETKITKAIQRNNDINVG